MSKISILMGIYNCAETLPDAICSILNQTVTDWELILCDDGSSDNTVCVALSFVQAHPDRIKLLCNPKNLGLNATLNRCLQVATGTYIARMDGDDICAPERFAEELAVMESEPNIAIVSTDMYFFDESGTWGIVQHPEYPHPRDFLAGSPFCHAPCMVRKEAYDAVGGYSVDKKLLRVEDYHLWIKMYKAGFRGKNIRKPLYSMRDDRNAYSRRKFRYRINEAYVRLLVVRELGLPASGCIYAMRPILVGLLPKSIYDKLHKWNLNRSSTEKGDGYA